MLYNENTILLMHMNDNIFKDECGHQIINNGVTLDTNNKVFGKGSGLFNGGYLEINLNNSELYKNSEFTIECSIYNKSVANAIISTSNFSMNNSKGWTIGIGTPGKLFFQQYSTGSNSSTVFEQNKWISIAIVYKNSKIYIFENGILKSTTSFNINAAFDSLYLGYRSDNKWIFNSNIDEIRISNIGRWTSDYEVSNKEYYSNRYLIKQNSNYYSIKEDYYNINKDIYNPQLISELDIADFESYGINDLSSIHNKALLKLIDNKYNIAMLK